RVGDVGKSAVAVVPKEDVPGRPDPLGLAIDPDTLGLVAAEDVVVRKLPVAVVGQIEIQVAIVIIIEERAAGGPVGPVDAGGLADVAERAVAIVEKQGVGTIVAEEEVGIAVVVDVAGQDAVTVTCEG